MSPSQSCSSRSPGVSITSPPPGRRSSSRCVVVWRPVPSVGDSRRPHQILAGEPVEERRLAHARGAEENRRPAPARRERRRASSPSPVRLDTGSTGTPMATLSVSRSRLSRSAQRSVFVSTTTGSRAALPGGREVALQPAEAEVVVEPVSRKRGRRSRRAPARPSRGRRSCGRSPCGGRGQRARSHGRSRRGREARPSRRPPAAAADVVRVVERPRPPLRGRRRPRSRRRRRRGAGPRRGRGSDRSFEPSSCGRPGGVPAEGLES